MLENKCVWSRELQEYHVHCALYCKCIMYLRNYRAQTALRENHCSSRFWFLSNNYPPDREDRKSIFIFSQQLKGDHTSKICWECPRKCVKYSSITGKPLARKWQCSKYLQQPPFNAQAVLGWNFQHSHKTHCHEWLLVLQSHYYWDNGTSLSE